MDDNLEKKMRKLLIIRVVLWILAAGGCVYWIAYSFWLYSVGIHEVHDYATELRPRLYCALAFSLVCLGISFLVRRRYDDCKNRMKQ